MAGLTVDGLVIATLTELRAAINARLQAAFGISIGVDDRTVEGQVSGILAENLAAIWELLDVLFAAADPDKASGAALDSLCMLTGTVREGATASAVTLTFTGTDGTAIPTGNVASTASTSKRFVTIENATLAQLDDWAATTPYVLTNRVNNASRSYQCITSGTSAGSGGPTTTAADITDGSVHWRYLGEGEAADDALAAAEETGRILAVSGDITTIETPLGGWSSVINLLDANPGRERMSDAELRRARSAELARAGTSPIDAIQTDIEDVADTLPGSVRVFVNNTDVTDSDGMPPHSVEVLVQGGDDQDIFDQLLASVAGGIPTTGNTPGTATDSQGTEHIVKFSRPVEKQIYVAVTLTKDPDTYPADGDDQVKAAIVTYGDAQVTGKDAVASRIAAACFNVAGVLDVVTCFIGIAPTPTLSATIAIAPRELATFDTSRVTVASSDATP